MARQKPFNGKSGTGDEAGIAVLILCLGHSICFPVVATLLPDLRSATPHAEILTRFMWITAFFVSVVVLATGFCQHQDRWILLRCCLGSVLLLLLICGGLYVCSYAACSSRSESGTSSGTIRARYDSSVCGLLRSLAADPFRPFVDARALSILSHDAACCRRIDL